MAPRTRSNRVEMLAREKMLASGQTFNTSGFAALPDDLYLEIVFHFPTYPIPRGYESVDIDILPSLRCHKRVVRYGLHSCDISGSALRYMMAWRQERDDCIPVMGVLLFREKNAQKNLFDSWRLLQCVSQT